APFFFCQTQQQLQFLLFPSPSQFNLPLQPPKQLHQQPKPLPLISIPNSYPFQQQSSQYKQSILPSHLTKPIAIQIPSPLRSHK
ncbi:transketolase-like TK C-terminal-containing protein, partial [Staphylococcus epidermidis]|uniref:transketolase-like TK C-terminal-containing protein n=1 Tax=Staphylococcus epidermidis TaxID=1282 RepID=UPI0037DA3A82